MLFFFKIILTSKSCVFDCYFEDEGMQSVIFKDLDEIITEHEKEKN